MLYVAGVGLLMPFVLSEPAPVDVWILCGGVMVLGAQQIPIPKVLMLASVVFLFASLLPMMLTTSSAEVGTAELRYYLIDVYLVLAFVLLYSIARARKTVDAVPEELLRWCCVGLAISAVLVLGLRFSSDPGWIYRDASRTRLRGTFEDPNVLGPYLSLPILCASCGLTSRRLTLLGVIPCGMLLILTGSRGGWLAVLVSLSMTVVILPLRLRRFIRIFAAAGLLWLVVSSINLSDIELIMKRLRKQAYDTDRFEHIVAAIDTLRTSPFGPGPGEFASRWGGTPHNLFLGQAMESGVLPAVIFLLVFVWAIVAAFRWFTRTGDRAALVYCAFLGGQLASSMFVNSVHWRHLVVLGAVALGAAHSRRQSAARTVPGLSEYRVV